MKFRPSVIMPLAFKTLFVGGIECCRFSFYIIAVKGFIIMLIFRGF